MRWPRFRDWLVLVGLLALNCPGVGQDRGKGRYETAGTDVSLKAANEAARAAYRAAREHALAECGPVVLWDGDELVFRYGNYRRVSRPIPALYHDLKTTGHMVLGLHALVAPYGDGEVNEKRLFELRRYLESVRAVRKAIGERGLKKAQLDRQQAILGGCEEYLEAVIRAGKVRVAGLVALVRRLRPLLDENGNEAVGAQIDGLHGEMTSYRGKLSEGEWKKLRVIVQGSQQPRKGNVAVRYFARLLGEEGEGGRIVYAEGLFDEGKALSLLGTKLVDGRLGQDVWDDPGRMHRDLLGDAAKAYIDELFKKGS